MGPKEKKKSTSPKKQTSLDGFLKPSERALRKRPREEENTAKESPKKKSRESEDGKCSPNNNNKESAAVNNNNNNNNNNKLKQTNITDALVPKAAVKKEKNQSPLKVANVVTKREKPYRLDVDTDPVDEEADVDSPDPLIDIPESDHLDIIVNPHSTPVPQGEGVFIGPNIIGNSGDFDAEPESHYGVADDVESEIGHVEEVDAELISTDDPIRGESPIFEAPAVPPSVASDIDTTRILTPSPSPSPQVRNDSWNSIVITKIQTFSSV